MIFIYCYAWSTWFVWGKLYWTRNLKELHRWFELHVNVQLHYNIIDRDLDSMHPLLAQTMLFRLTKTQLVSLDSVNVGFQLPLVASLPINGIYWTNFDHLGKDEGIINSVIKQSYCSYCYLLYASVWKLNAWMWYFQYLVKVCNLHLIHYTLFNAAENLKMLSITWCDYATR